MASFCRIAAVLTIIAAAGTAAVSDVAAQSSFSRCPKADQQAVVVKSLTAATERSRALAEDNPLLLADVAFYETELAATKRCVPAVAVATRTVR